MQGSGSTLVWTEAVSPVVHTSRQTGVCPDWPNCLYAGETPEPPPPPLAVLPETGVRLWRPSRASPGRPVEQGLGLMEFSQASHTISPVQTDTAGFSQY